LTTLSGGSDHKLVIIEAGRLSGHAFAMTSFAAALPPAAAGRWCRVVLSWPGGGPFWAKLELFDSARGQIVREAFFPPSRRNDQVMLLHIPQASGQLTLSLFTPRAASQTQPVLSLPVLSLRVLVRIEATLRLFAGGRLSLAGALRGSPFGLLGRLRAMLGQAAARRGQAPPYHVWIDLYDTWGDQERQALLSCTATGGSAEDTPPDMIEIRVMDDGSEAALTGTMASIAAQWRAPEVLSVIRTHDMWRVPTAEWVVMLACGETLAPHALACLAHAMSRNPFPLAIYADVDYYDAGMARSTPGLRPAADAWLMRSALLRDGAWIFHRSAFGYVQAGDGRLAAARRLPAARIMHVPLILTHCPPAPAPMDAPPSCTQDRGKSLPHVSIIVPSACRSWHVLQCLSHVAHHTGYANFDMLVAVSSCDPDDHRQAGIMRHVSLLPRTRVITLDMPDFNFAAVINRAAAQAGGDLLLLLNDDVSPITPGWLSQLVAFTEDEAEHCADIVGPRLLYGNGLVQHAGVIMGLANLCEHAFRLARSADPGPQGIARLTRQVSAVTAACMLVRRALFESLHGLDEAFAIALNDVDFCLRAGQAGACIVFAAGVDLYHFESLSLGRHYQGARAGLEAAEVRRLRDRWAFRISADPFYHPCASLELGREFTVGFPPRQTPLSWIGQEALAPH
jgi:GT2 family glycosyltransferase